MADFKIAFRLTTASEGGYVNDKDDPGGETYKGVARNIHGKWKGWIRIDILKRQAGFPGNLEQDSELQELLFDFYELEFWNKMNGDNIQDQDVANTIYDFGVNAGIKTSTSLAQMVVGAKADGVIGDKSIEAINSCNTDLFMAEFTLAKIVRYIHIVRKRPTSKKYFLGWVCDALNFSINN
jgi:lysozyme family protein